MSKMIIISNRLPITTNRDENGFSYTWSIGGLATGLKSYHNRNDSIWVGWPGIAKEDVTNKERALVQQELIQQYRCLPIFLSQAEIEQYYNGFCNRTIWPLFHYFPTKTEYDAATWQAYQGVNRKFFEAVVQLIEPGDTVWIHDYQLMLLPQMIKERYPDTRVAFFLHIPFPSFEVFRLLIWREPILRGLLGADLIGFHTYDYVRHFLSSVRRVLGLDHNLYRINYENHTVQVDAFPMGIDYDHFAYGSGNQDFMAEVAQLFNRNLDIKNILSIDRLDYTKGIPERIRAFGVFLDRYPEYMEKCRLTLVVAPSRAAVPDYDNLKREVFELVSRINGEYGTINWMPVWLFYQTFSQDKLVALYKYSDVLLVTPLRDGMNLVAKEYLATRTDLEGMLIISETAGAASELGEAVVINPNDIDAIADSIKYALEMPREERIVINRAIHERLKTYDVHYWAKDMMLALDNAVLNTNLTTSPNISNCLHILENAYRESSRRLLLLDYDGTLVGIQARPEQARPDQELRYILGRLVSDPRNTVVIISGRDKDVLDEWLGDLNLHFLAAHGLWLRHPGQEWKMTAPLDNEWKSSVFNLLKMFTNRMPGSLIEEKEYSLAFHYRQCEPDMVAVKLSEIREALIFMTQTTTLGLLEGNMVLEIKDTRVNKGYAASLFVNNPINDFILGVGDDFTDEDLFASLPAEAFSIKVGAGATNARYSIRSWKNIRSILNRFIQLDDQIDLSKNLKHA